MASARPCVSQDDLDQAMEWLSCAEQAGIEAAAFVDRRTGQVIWRSKEFQEEEISEDIEDESLYLPVPDRSEFDLGTPLVFRFVREQMPQAYDEVRTIFGRRGAYARFKSFLDQRGQLEAWFRYEEDAKQEALREWAQENGFGVE